MFLTESAYSHNNLCMRGRIYTDQKCSLCDSPLIFDDRRRGLFCQHHPEQQATRLFKVRFGRNITRRFSSFQEAERFLDGLRYEVDKGTFDIRDYQSSNPLSFSNLTSQWLKKKKVQVKPGTYQHLEYYIKVAQDYFGQVNVKSIQYGQLEDFVDSLQVSNKTRANYLSCLHNFWNWLLNRREITRAQFPVFPSISFELGFRKTIDKETQLALLDEVKRISYHVSPKIWLGIKWLCTYISIRPTEMRNIREGDIDRKQGFIYIPHPKEKRPKLVPLVDEDIEILNLIPPGLPDLYFFRYSTTYHGTPGGSRFGLHLFYKWWRRACKNLGIRGVDLYGGTRHSSAVALRHHATPEQIRRATMHSTNKAFERYFQVSKDELVGLYNLTNRPTSDQPERRSRKDLKG